MDLCFSSLISYFHLLFIPSSSLVSLSKCWIYLCCCLCSLPSSFIFVFALSHFAIYSCCQSFPTSTLTRFVPSCSQFPCLVPSLLPLYIYLTDSLLTAHSLCLLHATVSSCLMFRVVNHCSMLVWLFCLYVWGNSHMFVPQKWNYNVHAPLKQIIRLIHVYELLDVLKQTLKCL